MRDATIALQAALLATALEALGRFTWGGPYLPELLAERLFALIPAWAFTPLFRTFGYNSKYYAFAGMIATEVGGLTLAGTVLRAWVAPRLRERSASRWMVPIAGGSIGVMLVGALPLLDAAVAGQALGRGIWAEMTSGLIVAVGYATVLTRGMRR